MQRRTLLEAAAAALVAALAGPALAQPRDERERERRGPPRGPERRGPPGPREREEMERGHWPERPPEGWRRGGRLPPEYRHRAYVVDDWRVHRLRPPPRGYQWVAVGGDYLLVAIATGVILEVLAAR